MDLLNVSDTLRVPLPNGTRSVPDTMNTRQLLIRTAKDIASV
jgi:hypothetical protein